MSPGFGSAISANGMPINVTDYVRYPNPTAGAFPAFLFGVVTQTNSGANTINTTILNKDGTTTNTGASAVGINANTVYSVANSGGPGNAENNGFA